MKKFRLKKQDKPQRRVFEDSGSESDGDDFESAMAAKRQKVQSQIDLQLEYIEEKQKTPEKPAESSGKTSKYLEGILEAKKRREQDQMDAIIVSVDKRTEGAIEFESEEYKAMKKDAQSRRNVVEKDDGNFYSHLLKVKMNETSKSDEKNESNNIATKETINIGTKDYNEVPNKAISVEPSTPSPHLLQLLKSYCQSKISPSQLNDYKKRYWDRKKQERAQS